MNKTEPTVLVRLSERELERLHHVLYDAYRRLAARTSSPELRSTDPQLVALAEYSELKAKIVRHKALLRKL